MKRWGLPLVVDVSTGEFDVVIQALFDSLGRMPELHAAALFSVNRGKPQSMCRGITVLLLCAWR
jgi:hypothetical protein